MKNKTPRLSQVEPIISKLMIAFAIFNLVLGIGLFSLSARTLNFFIVNDVFNEQFWGGVFFATGIAMLVGFIINNWKLMRFSLVVGLALKFFWLLALGLRQFEDFDTNIFLLIFFAFVAVTQFVIYLHFPDKDEVEQWTHKQ